MIHKDFQSPYKGANGVLPLDFGWQGAFYQIVLTGGPYNRYNAYVENAYGVCVRQESVSGLDMDVHLPIVDFNVPKPEQVGAVNAALLSALMAAIDGKNVYVGCMGGWGRTGLFFALLAKVAGAEDPVEFVREYYTSHAVETKPQQEYVENFDVSDVQSKLFWYAWKKRIFFWL